MLEKCLVEKRVEAGCDEAGRGCLAGPVFAAAVVLPVDFSNTLLNDSKQLTHKQRLILKQIIEQEATAYEVSMVEPNEIDRINILNASILAMHQAISKLGVKPDFLLIDGNRFKPYPNIPHQCIIKGDSKYMSIAAASILAKVYRDEYMCKAGEQYPAYSWHKNKGYPTAYHRAAITIHGVTPLHRQSFKLIEKQLNIPFSK
ncbi:MAG: ribonuclease HII [Perlabentimonas sp.]